jgi:molybdopterin-binding protein
VSKLNATITAIESEKILNVVTFTVAGFTLKMISLELDKKAQINQRVLLSTKATTVAIAKDFTGALSYSNQILLQIQDIDRGKILTTLRLKEGELELESIITTSSCERMALKKGEKITALIKSSDLSISKFL